MELSASLNFSKKSTRQTTSERGFPRAPLIELLFVYSALRGLWPEEFKFVYVDIKISISPCFPHPSSQSTATAVENVENGVI